MQVQEVVAGAAKLEWAGLCVGQVQGVVPGYSQVKVPITFSPSVEGESAVQCSRGQLLHSARCSTECRRKSINMGMFASSPSSMIT
jgi:hypothetical protein